MERIRPANSIFSLAPVRGSCVATVSTTFFSFGQSTLTLTVLPKVLSILQSKDPGLLVPVLIEDILLAICIVKVRSWVSPGLIVISGHWRMVLPPLLLASSLRVPPPDSKIVEYCRTSVSYTHLRAFSGAKPLLVTFR